MSYKIGICDDEEFQLKVELLYLQEISKNNNWDIKHKTFNNPENLEKFLSKWTLDILLLDIDLGNSISGLELASKLMVRYPKMVIVFVTGHREFAYEAFDIDVTGYIVKPIDIKKLEHTLQKAMQITDAKKKSVPEKYLVITEENLKKRINKEDIDYIQRRQTKSIIVTKEKEYKVYETITSLYEKLTEDFIRVSQSEIVNKRKIKEIHNKQIYLTTGDSFSIGRTFQKDVIGTYLGKIK